MILKKYLEKIGVSEFSELTPEEKETYRTYEETLNGRKLTDDEVKQFFAFEMDDTVQKLITKKHNSRTDIFLKMKLDMLRRLTQFLNIPDTEKRSLEDNLRKQL